MLSDKTLRDIVINGDRPMISPFLPYLVNRGLSAGMGGNSYDARLAATGVRLISDEGATIDPTNFDVERDTEEVEARTDTRGNLYYLAPPQSYILGVTVEYFDMPPDVCAVVLGKSTYARTGLICNTTPIDAGFKGHVTLEFLNPLKNSSIKLYAMQGVAQLLFFKLDQPPEKPYDDTRKYQNQEAKPVGARVLL